MNAKQNEETLVQESTKEGNEKTVAKTAGEGKSKTIPKKSTSRSSVDPYIRNLLVIASLVIVGALLTVIFAYFNGVIDFDQSRPANIQEFTVAASTVYADMEQTAGSHSQWAISLIGNGQFLEAERLINEALQTSWPDTERNQGIMFAYAVLADALGDTETAIERYEYVRSQLRKDFDRVYNDEALDPNWARAFGMHPNYFDSAIALAFIYRDKGDYEKEIEMLTIGIWGNPTAADLYLFRGQAKLKLGDAEGAIADFNEVLRFLPGDEDALKGLEEAGGTIE